MLSMEEVAVAVRNGLMGAFVLVIVCPLLFQIMPYWGICGVMDRLKIFVAAAMTILTGGMIVGMAMSQAFMEQVQLLLGAVALFVGGPILMVVFAHQTPSVNMEFNPVADVQQLWGEAQPTGHAPIYRTGGYTAPAPSSNEMSVSEYNRLEAEWYSSAADAQQDHGCGGNIGGC